MQPPNEEFFTLVSKAGSNIVTMVDEIGAAVRSYRTTTKPARRELRP